MTELSPQMGPRYEAMRRPPCSLGHVHGLLEQPDACMHACMHHACPGFSRTTAHHSCLSVHSYPCHPQGTYIFLHAMPTPLIPESYPSLCNATSAPTAHSSPIHPPFPPGAPMHSLSRLLSRTAATCLGTRTTASGASWAVCASWCQTRPNCPWHHMSPPLWRL